MNRYKYVILGAGPTGLGAAYRLRELGIDDFIVIDRQEQAGGLSSSFTDEQGFTWDLGGHVQFSHYHYFDQLMDKALGQEGWLHHQRESWVWIRERFVPYPFQNNIRYLPQEDMWRCLQGLIREYKTATSAAPADFREWIHRTFGQGLAELFMLPYNFKVWAYPPELMSYQWIGERVAVTDLERLTKNVLFDLEDISWGPNNTFRFPKQGGTGAIWQAVAGLVGATKLDLGRAVLSVDERSKTVTCSGGRHYAYDTLINTLPLDQFTGMLQHADPSLTASAKQLLHSTTHVIGIGLNGQPDERLKTKCWMYFPEDNCPFYRVTVFSNYSPANVPDAATQWSLMAEVSESPYKQVDREALIAATIQGMLETQLISSADAIVSTWYKALDYGYPTPSLDRDKILARVLPELEQQQIYSRGRFGGWKYEVSNQDHSLMQGVELINRLELGVPELSFPFPATANAMYGKQ